MNFSEFLTRPNQYTKLFNTTQTSKILYPERRKKILRLTLYNRNNANNLF